jgi:hypothetical protein
MTLTYRVDSALNVVFETWSGALTRADLRDGWERLMSDPAVQACRRSLADLTGAEFRLTGAELEDAVRGIILPRVQGGPWCSALVVSTPLSYGVSRQFQVFAEAGLHTAIFRDPDAAFTWLLMPDPAE